MNSNLVPILNKIYVFHKPTLLYLGSGSGIFQVDFRNYHFTGHKVLFLSPGQYFQLLSGNYEIKLFEFPYQTLSEVKNSRYLFQHLISLRYIPSETKSGYYLSSLLFLDSNSDSQKVLENLVKDWILLNPFEANPEEIDLLFDIKSVIDHEFPKILSLTELSKSLQESPFRIQDLAKEKLEQSIPKWMHSKILLEAKRKIIFTNQTIKEIAYNTGFRDPNYFHRFFKNHAHKTPSEFREDFEQVFEDPFLSELNHLIELFFKSQHLPSFYATQLGMSLKTFSRKLENQFQTSFSHLIQERLIHEAISRMKEKQAIYGIAFELGFKEPNHFTAFFKKHTGKTPSQFL